MNLTAAVKKFVTGNQIQEAGLGHSLATLSTIDSDDHLFRKLTQSTRDLSSLTHERQREIGYFLYDTNPFAKRIINMTRDFVAVPAEQWSIEHNTDDDVDALLKKFWSDPINAWVKRLPDRVKELGLAGEQCYMATTSKADGIVRIAYVDPGAILGIKMDKVNSEIVDEIILKQKMGGVAEKLKGIAYDMEKMRMLGLPIEQQGPDGGGGYIGQCFFWALNKPVKATRGRSDLFVLADSLGMLDDFHWNRMEKSALTNSFIWDVTLKNMNEAQIEEYAKNQKAPRPGTARFHNENVEWKAEAPDLNADDASNEGKMMRIPITAGSGFPDMWLFGVGEDANRAAAYEMTDPPMRMMAERQAFVVAMIVDMCRYQIDMGIELKKVAAPAGDDRYDFSVNVPEISSRDMAKAATALRDASLSIIADVEAGLISRETAVSLVAFIASQLGYDVDAAKELENMKEEEVERIELDAKNPPPQLPPDPEDNPAANTTTRGDETGE